MSTVLEPPVLRDATTGPASTTATPALDRRAWIGFTVILAAMVLNILDSTIVNVAAPSIQRDLAMRSASLEWVAAAYTLALAVGLMTGARLGDMFGRKRMLTVGLVGFVTASTFCSVAWTSGVLVGGRAAQGLAAAVMVPQTFGLIREIFGPEHIAKAFAAFGPVIGLSTILGPVVAGLLMKADLFGGTGDWRAIFLINLPVGLAALLVGARVLPSGHGSHGVRLDVVGTLLLGTTAFLVIFPLVDGRALGWPTWTFGVLVAAVPVFVLFVVQQRGRLAAGRSPLVEPSILRKRSFVSGVAFTVVFFATVVGFSLVMGLFLQIGLGFTAMHAALYLAAMALGAFVGAGVGAWATTAVGRPILHVGLSIMAAGTLVLWAALRSVDTAVGFWSLAPGLFVFGLGMGMIFVPLFSIVISEIDDHEVGSASGLLESMQQLGASLGVAALATLFFDRLAIENGGPRAVVAAGRHLVATQDTLLAVVALIAVAWALGWLLPRQARDMC